MAQAAHWLVRTMCSEASFVPFLTDILTAAIACNIASGLGLKQSVRAAGRYVEAGIQTSKNLGHGSGPIHHFHSLNIVPFPPYVSNKLEPSLSRWRLTCVSGGFVEYLLDRPDVSEVWQDFTHHEFVKKLGDGTLPVERFKYYMVQDYLYLVSCCCTEFVVQSIDRSDPIRESKRAVRIQGEDTGRHCSCEFYESTTPVIMLKPV